MEVGNQLQNVNPRVRPILPPREVESKSDPNSRDPFDAREIFDHIRTINDPEHPLTLEQLSVVDLDQVEVDDDGSIVRVVFTPTIPHCSMATLIGLAIRVKLLRALPGRFKVDVRVAEGSHVSEAAINKQLADKERVAAALENKHLLNVINDCLRTESPDYKSFLQPMATSKQPVKSDGRVVDYEKYEEYY